MRVVVAVVMGEDKFVKRKALIMYFCIFGFTLSKNVSFFLPLFL